MVIIKNKKAKEPLGESVIFIILNVLFIVMLALFIWNSSSGSAINEEAYAKEIALAIDHMQGNMTFEMDISELVTLAEKNKYSGIIVQPVYDENRIIVRVNEGRGYTFHYFTEGLSTGSISENRETKKLLIKT